MGVVDELNKLDADAKEAVRATVRNVFNFFVRLVKEFVPAAPLEVINLTAGILALIPTLLIGMFVYLAFIIPPVLLGAVAFGVENLVGPTGLALMNVVLEQRKMATPTLNKITVATMADLFGVDFEGIGLPEEASPEASLQRARIIGDAIFDLLEKEFVPDGALSPEQGELAAKAFTGFSANFAVSSAFITLLGEVISLGAFEAFRELGVELADNLGLGRMSRRGLSELVSKTVSDPYEWFLNKKYRPTGLSRGEALEAQRRGIMESDELAEKLKRDGYSDDKIAVLLNLQRTELTASQLINSFERGDLDDGELLDRMRKLGYGDEDTRR
ncbi:MAG: hypothetical protein ACRD2K_06130, partial [Terriglobales bacterium]